MPPSRQCGPVLDRSPRQLSNGRQDPPPNRDRRRSAIHEFIACRWITDVFKLRMMADMLERTQVTTIENLPHSYCDSSEMKRHRASYATGCANAPWHSIGNITKNIEGSIF